MTAHNAVEWCGRIRVEHRPKPAPKPQENTK